MPRRLLNRLTALSIVLCVAACALWARSEVAGDQVNWWRRSIADEGATAKNLGWFVGAGGGWVAAGRQVISGPAGDFGTVPSSGWEPGSPDPLRLPPYLAGRRLVVIEWGRQRTTIGPIRYNTAGVAAPLWVVVAVAALLPLIRIRVIARETARRWRRWRDECSRRRAGLCRGCGYDLRASPDRCPECGAVPGPRRPEYSASSKA